MTKSLTVFSLGLLLLATSAAAADSFILNPSADASELSADELKAIFNGGKTTWPNKTRIRVVVPGAGPGNEALMSFLGKSSNQFKTSWKKLVFSGNGTLPETLADDAEVAAYVAKTPGAIGFIAAAPPAGVTVVPKP